jgi:hypothetical protein
VLGMGDGSMTTLTIADPDKEGIRDYLKSLPSRNPEGCTSARGGEHLRIKSHDLFPLKRPKHEIFESGFFTEIRPVLIGDLGTGEKNEIS